MDSDYPWSWYQRESKPNNFLLSRVQGNEWDWDDDAKLDQLIFGCTFLNISETNFGSVSKFIFDCRRHGTSGEVGHIKTRSVVYQSIA